MIQRNRIRVVSSQGRINPGGDWIDATAMEAKHRPRADPSFFFDSGAEVISSIAGGLLQVSKPGREDLMKK